MLKEFIKLSILEALWEPPDLDQYASGDYSDLFDSPPSEEEIKASDLYRGRNVVWLGTKGRMLKVDSSILSPAEGNLFDFEKMAAIRDYINDAEDDVYFEASPAQVVIIDLQTIIETQRTHLQGRLNQDYDNISEPFSTGEKELDLFLADESEWADENYIDLNEIKLFMKSPEEWMKEWSIDPEEMTEGEQEDIERIQSEIKQYQEMQQMVKDAVDEEWGDIGTYWVDLRDGNHRAFGALAAGEPYIWVYAIPERTDPKAEEDLQ